MKSFEKNIKKEADSFYLSPAPNSFELVMKALEKKKKRRFIFWIWLLFPGLVMGAAGILATQYYTTTDIYSAPLKNPISFYASNVVSNHIASYKKKQIENKTSFLSEIGDNHISSNPIGSLEVKKQVNTKINTYQSTHNNTHFSVANNIGDKIKNHSTIIADTNIIMLDTNNNVLVTKNTVDTTLYIRYTKSTHTSIPFSLVNISAIQLPIGGLHPSISPINTPKVFTRNLNKINNVRRFSLGAYSEVGVMRSIFYNNVPPDSLGTSNEYTDARKSADKFLFSYSAGIKFRYSPFKFLAIETGIGFSRYESSQIVANAGYSFTLSSQDFTLDTVLTISAQNYNQASQDSQEYHNIYDYISIPIKFYYQKKWNWTGIEAGGGVVFDIPANTHSYVMGDSAGISYLRHNVQDSRLNMFGIQASANVNMLFHVKKFSFYIGPVFKYRLNSMFDKDYIIRQHGYFIGAETGIRYNF